MIDKNIIKLLRENNNYEDFSEQYRNMMDKEIECYTEDGEFDLEETLNQVLQYQLSLSQVAEICWKCRKDFINGARLEKLERILKDI